MSIPNLPYDHYFWLTITVIAWYCFIRDGFIVWRYKSMTCNPRQLEKLVEARKAFRNWWSLIVILSFISAGLIFRFIKDTNV